jgi:hypothetical protein
MAMRILHRSRSDGESLTLQLPFRGDSDCQQWMSPEPLPGTQEFEGALRRCY